MRESGIEYKVGLLIATSAVLFAGFIFLLGNCSLRGGYTVYVDYDFSGNVQEGAPVKVSGIKVGRVENVAFLGSLRASATTVVITGLPRTGETPWWRLPLIFSLAGAAFVTGYEVWRRRRSGELF